MMLSRRLLTSLPAQRGAWSLTACQRSYASLNTPFTDAERVEAKFKKMPTPKTEQEREYLIQLKNQELAAIEERNAGLAPDSEPVDEHWALAILKMELRLEDKDTAKLAELQKKIKAGEFNNKGKIRHYLRTQGPPAISFDIRQGKKTLDSITAADKKKFRDYVAKKVEQTARLQKKYPSIVVAWQYDLSSVMPKKDPATERALAESKVKLVLEKNPVRAIDAFKQECAEKEAAMEEEVKKERQQLQEWLEGLQNEGVAFMQRTPELMYIWEPISKTVTAEVQRRSEETKEKIVKEKEDYEEQMRTEHPALFGWM